ncbi:hypothetical protein FAZ69_15520 [Trinickia terrae]|uniref:Uncharacterized protein n=1 Tax=Trinickia terrae TaxID=2571161 RepID=A0A4V5PIJ9_9BURK|nr:hypothetical protein [Trinickia terrae]TKC87700.1 hypothetical protein FAZ69_15520 [Trinickia terrae]
MNIIDHEPHMWFLAEENGTLYLDAACSHGAVGYNFLIELSSQELAEYHSQGHDYLNRLAEDIHNSAPALVNSFSKYKGRKLAPELSERFNVALRNWRG